MIDKIDREQNFFREKLEKEDKRIWPVDFDSQFNDISKYLNDTLKPEVDTLASEVVKGEAGNIGAFLHNVGDGTTDWQRINSDKLDDASISFDKIIKGTAGSILISGVLGDLEELIPINNNQVLVSRNANTPTWSLITDDHIEPATLTGNQFGMLAMENFVANQFITNIVPNVIATGNIQDKAVTNDKLLDASITSDKLGEFVNLPVPTKGVIKVQHINDGAITPDKIKDGSIPITYNNRDSNLYMEIWSNEYGKYTADGGWVYKQLLVSDHLKDNSIDEVVLPQILYKANDSPEAERVEAAKAFFPAVPVAFQFQSDHIALDSLDEDMFDNEVKAAFARL